MAIVKRFGLGYDEIMIALLDGTIELKTGRFIVVGVNKVGYKVFCPGSVLEKLAPKKPARLFVHQHIREDASDLYGFLSFEELDFFELLISVSGVGPKAALSIMALCSVDELKQAISSGQKGLLTKVSGIGSKTAERLILELKDKVFAPVGDIQRLSVESEVMDALLALGYTQSQARNALKQVPANVKEIGDRVKEALKILGK